MVDMMSQAFSAVWKQEDQHPKLADNEFTCYKASLELQIQTEDVTAPLEYPDLIIIGELISRFQQQYILPGLDFEFWLKGQQIGHGLVQMRYA